MTATLVTRATGTLGARAESPYGCQTFADHLAARMGALR
jgi:hypothetical protein